MLTNSQKRAATISGLKRLGMSPVLGYGDYEAFCDRGGVVYLVGRRAALRATTGGLADSISLTNMRLHNAVIAVGLGDQSPAEVARLLLKHEKRARNLAVYQC